MATAALGRRVRSATRVDAAVRRCAVTFVTLLSLAMPLVAVAQERLLDQPLRVRIAWGGRSPERWVGRMTLEGGTLANPQLLGMEADAAAAVWLDGNTLAVDTPTPHLFDGVDITASSARNTRLVISLSAPGAATPIQTQVPLADVLRAPFHMPLDDHGNELLVQRSPGDTLRISTSRQSLLFRPGEQFSFDLEPLLEGIEPSTTIDITTTLLPARGGATLWSHEQRLPVPVEGPAIATMHVPLPRDEGVYQVRLSVARPPGFRERFLPGGGAQPLVERSFQVVVLGTTSPATTPDAGWETVLEIDPANPRWTERLPDWTQLRRIPGFSRRPLGSMRATTVAHSLGNFVELPPTPSNGEPHWQAYSLPLESAGVPHLLEVEYPNDREQHLGISIVEPNAAERVVPITRDSGVYVEGLGHAEYVEKAKHRLVFWPRTNAPLLLVTNQHPTSAGRFGAVRVLRHNAKSLSAPATPAAVNSDRLIAAYFARPLVPETFGASEGLDAPSGQSVDDWQTFFEGAGRLAEYLEYAGYNAAVVNALADGSPVFLSDHVPATPVHNTGRMAVGASDLPPIDALELMLQVFDRRGLAFIPTLQFAAPLPELEAQRRGLNPRDSGIELVNAEGRTWREVYGDGRGLAPHYNLLDERVQQALLNVARDVLQRYGNHRSLAGLGVQLSGRGYAVLPDVKWGLDDATLDHFERETGVSLPPGGIGRRQAAVLREHGEQWRRWRAARVSRFYAEMAKLIRANDSRRRLILTTEDLFATPEFESRIRPNVVAKSRLDRTMLDLAIDRDALRQTPGIVFCPTRYVESMNPLVDRAIDLEVNEMFATARQETANLRTAAMMLYHRPQRQALPSFDAKSPFKANHTLLVTQSAAHGSLSLRPYVAAMLDADPTVILDGGELLPLGEPEVLRRARATLRDLPTTARINTKRGDNLLVRTFERDGETICLVVNELPWHVDAALEIELPSAATVVPLDGEAATPVETFAAGQQTWPLRLAPYELRAVRFGSAGLEVVQIESAISESGRRELAQRQSELRSRDLNTSRPYAMLNNPNFEPPTTGGLEGWRLVDPGSAATAELDATNPQDGATCIYLQNRGAETTATLESNSFSTPPTGQLAMFVFVRGRNLGPRSEVRLVFETDGDKPYRRFATLGGNRPGSQALGSEWGVGYAFSSADLPLDSRGKMRVKFELAGPGEVWIDSVRLFDLLFPLPNYEHAQPEKLEFVKLITAVDTAIEEGKLAECVELLEGYWPRFLAEYAPVDNGKVVEQPELPPQPPTTPSPPADEEPSVIGRWFSWPGTQKR